MLLVEGKQAWCEDPDKRGPNSSMIKGHKIPCTLPKRGLPLEPGLGVVFLGEDLGSAWKGNMGWPCGPMIHKVQREEPSFVGRMAGYTLLNKVRSWVIQEELHVEPLLLHTEWSQLRWLEHLIRIFPSHLLLEVYQAQPTGERPWGCPRTRWRDYISKLSLELENVAVDRVIWDSLLSRLLLQP